MPHLSENEWSSGIFRSYDVPFRKDEDTFMRFAIEVFASNAGMSKLKYVGVDMVSAIFNGFKRVFSDLNRLSCVHHVGKRDDKKLDKLPVEKTKAKSEILKDIYGEHNGASYNFSLAESFDNEDFEVKLFSLKDKWNSLCPGFQTWFNRKCQSIFCESTDITP